MVIIDKPNVRKEYEKIGYFAEGRVNESKSDVLQSLSEIKSLIYSLYQEMSKVQKHLDPKDAQKIKKLMSRPLGDLGKSTSFIKSLSRQMESVNEGIKYKDHEIEMAISELKSVCRNSKELLQKFSMGQYEELPAWVQSKLTLSQHNIQAVYDWCKGKDGVYESTDAYQKSLEKIASDKKLNMISKKDKETLKKIAQMMSKNEGKMSPEKVYDYFLYMRKYKPDIWKDMKINKDVKKIMKKFESVTEVFRLTESGIMYRAGVKKYGKEGMRKIQSAAGKGLGHAEIGKIKDQYDKKKKKKKSESIDELTLTEGSVFDINNAEQMFKVLTAGLKKVAPEIKPGNISYSTLGGDDRVSIVGKFSLDRKKDWSNGILENSRWITFYLDNDGSLEVNVMGYPLDMRKQVKMRKSRNKDIKQVLARMLKHFHMLNTKYPQGLS